VFVGCWIVLFMQGKHLWGCNNSLSNCNTIAVCYIKNRLCAITIFGRSVLRYQKFIQAGFVFCIVSVGCVINQKESKGAPESLLTKPPYEFFFISFTSDKDLIPIPISMFPSAYILRKSLLSVCGISKAIFKAGHILLSSSLRNCSVSPKDFLQ